MDEAVQTKRNPYQDWARLDLARDLHATHYGITDGRHKLMSWELLGAQQRDDYLRMADAAIRFLADDQ